MLGRLKQRAKEKVGKASEVTKYPEDFEDKLLMIDHMKEQMPKFLDHLNKVSAVYGVSEVLGMTRNKEVTRAEKIQEEVSKFVKDSRMINLTDKVPTTAKFLEHFTEASEQLHAIAQEEKLFMVDVASKVIMPIKEFIDGDLKAMEKAKSTLKNRRLDMDNAKSNLASKEGKEGTPADKLEAARNQCELKTKMHDDQYKVMEDWMAKMDEYGEKIAAAVYSYVIMLNAFWEKKLAIIEKK